MVTDIIWPNSFKSSSKLKTYDHVGEDVKRRKDLTQEAIGEPCGFNTSYTFYKGLQIISPANKTNVNSSTNPLTINLPSITASNKNKPTTRKCVVDRRNEKHSNCNIAIFKHMVLTLGDFIPVKPWSDSHIACLAEIRMIWRDKNEQSLLTGLRLYFLPENTPSGRNCHGEDEVLAISDKVVIRAEDLLNWFDEKLEWNWGLVSSNGMKKDDKGNTQIQHIDKSIKLSSSLKNSQMNFSDVQIEKNGDKYRTNITVLSYPRYCRFRATMKRLEGVTDEWLKNSVVAALCGFNHISSNYRVMFCRDTFDYPELETHELLCNHLAPKLKGRRRKLFSRSESPFSATKKNYDSASDSNESDISLFSVANEKVFLRSQQAQSHLRCNYRAARSKGKFETSINKKELQHYKIDNNINAGYEENYNEKSRFLRANISSARYRSNQLSEQKRADDICNRTNAQEKFFLRKLHEFHIRKKNDIPHMLWLNLKGAHLYSIFRQVKKLGGYEAVTDKKLWKNLFGENNLPHLTITRRKYAKLLLPLEKSDVFRKNTSIKSGYVESESENKAVSITTEKGINFKFKIKDEISGNCASITDADLNTKEMTEIQSKLKSKVAIPNRNELLSTDDVKFVTTVNSTSNKISVPVTVIVGTSQDTKNIISSDNNKNSILSSNTMCGKNLAKKFQIQQPHTTITFHQTTIHPHTNSNKITNKIQITNQIQIQQITVQPTTTDMQVGSAKNEDTKLIKIEDNNLNTRDLNQTLRVKSSENMLTKDKVPFIAPGTTITPVLSTLSSVPRATRKKLSTNINTKNIKETNSTIGSTSSSQSSSMTNETKSYTINQDFFSSFKKRKLDILREGGLEVTPISNKHGVISSAVPLTIPKLNKNLERTSKFDISSMLDVSVPSTNRINIKKPQIAANSMYTKTDKIFGNPREMFCDSAAYTSSKEKILEDVLDLTVNTSKNVTPVYLQASHNITNESTSYSPLDLSTAFITPNIPKFSENGLQITLVPASQQTSPFQPMTYTQNVHNSQNHNMKRKAVDTTHTTSSEISLDKIKPSFSDETTLTSLKPPVSFSFPQFIPNITSVAAATQHDFLPMYLSNLYGQASNLFLSNEIPQELLQLYKSLPTNFGMVPVTKS